MLNLNTSRPKLLLFAVPAVIALLGLWTSATRGAHFVGETPDPDYVYAFNALSIVSLNAPVHNDHPGTPAQAFIGGTFVVRHATSCLMGPCASIIEEVIADPEKYISFGSVAITALLIGVLYYVGLSVLTATESILAAITFQLTMFLCPIAVLSLGRVNPEPLLLTFSLLFVLPFLKLIQAETTDSPLDESGILRLAAAAGVLFGAGLSTKITFFPLALLVFALPEWRHRVRFFLAALASIAVCLLPIASRLPGFGAWVFALATHKGLYGDGGTGFPDSAALMKSFLNVMRDEPMFLVAIVAMAIVARILPELRKPLILASAICTLQLLLVLKHPWTRYLIPSFGALALGATLIVLRGGRKLRIATAVLALIAAYPVYQSMSKWAQHQQRYNLSAIRTHAGIKAAPQCEVIGTYGSSNMQFSLHFGDDYTGGLFAPALASLYPESTYQHLGGAFLGWKSEDRTGWLLEQLRAGRCILLDSSNHYKAAWPEKLGLEKTEVLLTETETLYQLSLPGIQIKRPAIVPSSGTMFSATPLPSAPRNVSGSVKIEAERPSGGNAVADTNLFGAGIGVITSPKVPAVVEYQITVPKKNSYELYVRYASETARPATLSLNGSILTKEFGAAPTGGYYPASQKWFYNGTYDVPEGKAVLRLESGGPLPHIDKILLIPKAEQ